MVGSHCFFAAGWHVSLLSCVTIHAGMCAEIKLLLQRKGRNKDLDPIWDIVGMCLSGVILRVFESDGWCHNTGRGS